MGEHLGHEIAGSSLRAAVTAGSNTRRRACCSWVMTGQRTTTMSRSSTRPAGHWPGAGSPKGARVLGEFGDDPTRYVDAKARKAYAGTAPITRASGTKKVVMARYARNTVSYTH